jgi:glycosyltransferase involved in cell wall biosynthesis
MGHDIHILSLDQAVAQSFYPLPADITWKKSGLVKGMKKLTPLSFLRTIVFLKQEIRRENPDIVVAFMHSMFVSAAFAAIGTGVPVIASEHIVPQHYKKRPFEFFLLLLSSFFIKKITVISEAVKELYPAFLHAKIVPIANPVTVYHSVAATREPIILNVGRLAEQKDQKTLIQAFAHLAADFPDWNLRIIGEGELRQNLEELCQKHGLTQRVTLPGVTKDMQGEYARASVVVVSSLYESFGLATAEAMSAGVPAIGFKDCPGTNEIIEDGISGVLVNGSDRVQVLEEGLRNLLSSEEERARMGRSAQKRITEKFGIDVVESWQRLLQSEAKAQRS